MKPQFCLCSAWLLALLSHKCNRNIPILLTLSTLFLIQLHNSFCHVKPCLPLEAIAEFFSGLPEYHIILNNLFAGEAVGSGIKKEQEQNLSWKLYWLFYFSCNVQERGAGRRLQCGAVSCAPSFHPTVMLPSISQQNPSNVIMPHYSTVHQPHSWQIYCHWGDMGSSLSSDVHDHDIFPALLKFSTQQSCSILL